jgi:radical SAM superfamily enzyme YgiQ (UPF0313 family)
MRVLLIRPDPSHLYNTAGPDLGLGYLTTALRRAGHEVFIHDALKKRRHREPVATMVRRVSPDFIGFKTFSLDVAAINLLAEQFTPLCPAATMAVGGPFPTGIGAELFAHVSPRVRFGMAGEGERALPQLLEHLQGQRPAEQVAGLIWRDGPTTRRNAQDFPPDLDALGWADFSQMPPRTYPVDYEGNVYVPVQTSRGCPFTCAYCSAGLMNGRLIRRRSAAVVGEEVARLRRDFGIRNFCLIDDNFTLIKEHALAICDRLIELDLGVKWRCPSGLRLDTLDEQILHRMEQSGCYEVYVGIESGSERVAADMKRCTSLAVLIEKVRLIRRVTRFSMLGFFILGYPTEELADARQTIRLAATLPLDMASFFYFTPHPGTEIHQRLVAEFGLRTDWRDHFYDRMSDVPRRLSRRRLWLLQKWAYLRFYCRPGPLLFLARKLAHPGQALRLIQRVAAVALNR